MPAVVNESTVDLVGPTLTEGHCRFDGDRVGLSFDEILDGDNRPAAGDFAVTADGASVTVGSVFVDQGCPAADGVPPVITQGQEVIVSYADPGAGDDAAAIQDALGNDAASTSPPARTACPRSATSPPSRTPPTRR